MMASKGPEDAGRVERSGVDEARRSVAEGPPVAVPWIWDAEKRLRTQICQHSDAQRAQRERRTIPLDSNGELPGAGARLNNNVGLLDTAGEELLLCTGDEGLDDGRVPAGVDDGDAQVGAIVVLRGGTLERRHCGRLEMLSARYV